MGEYFRDNGKHVLVIYDDLSKQAVAYRQLALLLRRPPGREAYPGDVFYLHSRLLERAAKMREDWIIVDESAPETTCEGVDGVVYPGPRGKKQAEAEAKARGTNYKVIRHPKTGGSLAALPIIETQAGDVSAYIPTNVISITDGQIYVSTSLFLGGQRPAINVGLSVSRTGGAAQQKQLKKLSASLRIELSRMREQEKFARYGGNTGGDMAEGKLLNSLLIQSKDTIYSAAEEAAILAAYRCGAFSSVPLSRIGEAITKMLADLHENDRALLENIEASGNITDTNLDALIGAVKRHLASYC